MIVAIGIDLVEISRIEEVFARRGDRFRARIFTEGEIGYCERRASKLASYAARFAAKEAAMKALGTGWSDGVGWRDIEVVSEPSGAPTIRFHGRALERMSEIGGTRALVSLTHSANLAMAQVVLEGDPARAVLCAAPADAHVR
ncbi:MAG: holo-ACP synthase [Acidobacteriota bacterium]